MISSEKNEWREQDGTIVGKLVTFWDYHQSRVQNEMRNQASVCERKTMDPKKVGRLYVLKYLWEVRVNEEEWELQK